MSFSIYSVDNQFNDVLGKGTTIQFANTIYLDPSGSGSTSENVFDTWDKAYEALVRQQGTRVIEFVHGEGNGALFFNDASGIYDMKNTWIVNSTTENIVITPGFTLLNLNGIKSSRNEITRLETGDMTQDFISIEAYSNQSYRTFNLENAILLGTVPAGIYFLKGTKSGDFEDLRLFVDAGNIFAMNGERFVRCENGLNLELYLNSVRSSILNPLSIESDTGSFNLYQYTFQSGARQVTTAYTGVGGAVTIASIENGGGQFVKTSDPTATDDGDSLTSYRVGTTWVNTNNQKVFICVDNTSGAAVWKEL